MILGITGPIGAGKSTTLKTLHAEIKRRGVSCGGIISERVYDSAKLIGYSLTNVSDGRVFPLARKEEYASRTREQDCIPFWNFRFFKKAMLEGKAAIQEGLEAEVLFIDEVGLWEVDGGGWAESLPLLRGYAGTAMLGLRFGVSRELEKKTGLSFAGVVNLTPGDIDEGVRQLLRLLNR